MYTMPVYRLGIYEKALKPKPLEEMFADAAKAGYDNFEISLDETDERLARLTWPQDKLNSLRNAAEESGIQLFSACYSGSRRFALGSMNKEDEREALDMLSKAIDFSVNLGVRVLQITGFDVYNEPQSQETSDRYLKNLFVGAEMAASAGVMLAIEPVEGHIMSVRRAMDFVTQVNSPWLQVYPDPANILAMGFDPVEEMVIGQGHIVGLHLRDAIPGTSYNIPWGEGSLDFVALFYQLQAMRYNSPILIEYWYEEGDDYLHNAQASREFLLQKIEEAHNKFTMENKGH